MQGLASSCEETSDLDRKLIEAYSRSAATAEVKESFSQAKWWMAIVFALSGYIFYSASSSLEKLNDSLVVLSSSVSSVEQSLSAIQREIDYNREATARLEDRIYKRIP